MTKPGPSERSNRLKPPVSFLGTAASPADDLMGFSMVVVMILLRKLRVRARFCALGRVQRSGSVRGGRSRLRYRLHVLAEAAQADAQADLSDASQDCIEAEQVHQCQSARTRLCQNQHAEDD